MIRFLSQMFKLPLAAFVASIEIITIAMRELQKTFDQSVDVMVSETAEALANFSIGGHESEIDPGNSAGDGVMTDRSNPAAETTHEEDGNMPDQDLGGENLKVVRYRILFTKRDFEVTLEEAEDDVVNYPTDPASYGGLKVAQFFRKVAQGKIGLPQKWREKNYPQKNAPDRGWKIPEEDERYVTFIYEVVRQVEREEAEYDKQKVEILREIRDKL